MVTDRKSQIISKPLSNISLAQAIEECKKEVERNVNAESDPMLLGILRGRIHLSASDIAERIERKVIEGVVVTGDNGIIDPKQTTVTKAEAYKLMDFVRRRLADAKARFMAQKEYFSDPDNSLELQAKFYQLDEHAALAGLTALEAANLLLIREGDLLERHGISCIEQEAPLLAERLLTLDEMQRFGPRSEYLSRTIHPLSEWVVRAKEKKIEYLPALDYAVFKYGPDRQQLDKAAGAERKWTAAHATKMRDEKNEERKKNTKNYAVVVAKRYGISASRMNKIIRDHTPKPVGGRGSIAEIATTKVKR